MIVLFVFYANFAGHMNSLGHSSLFEAMEGIPSVSSPRSVSFGFRSQPFEFPTMRFNTSAVCGGVLESTLPFSALLFNSLSV